MIGFFCGYGGGMGRRLRDVCWLLWFLFILGKIVFLIFRVVVGDGVLFFDRIVREVFVSVVVVIGKSLFVDVKVLTLI